MLDDVRKEDDVLQPFDGVMRWTDSLALGCINELIERLPCPGFFEKKKEHRLLARRG